MPNPTVVGLYGNFHRPSKTSALISSVAGRISRQYGLTSEIYDLIDVGDSLGSARHVSELGPAARNILDRVVASDLLVVGTPTYKSAPASPTAKHTHDWKRQAERLMRASGRAYTIVRPGWFDYNEQDHFNLVVLQGDNRQSGAPRDGVVARRQIAEVLVRSLTSNAELGKTFEPVAERG